MPKLKTKKTLMKRIKITRRGKILRNQTRIGHLKRKWDSSKHSRKGNRKIQENLGHRKIIKRLLGKAGRKIK